MHTNEKEIKDAIARTTKKAQDEIFNIARNVGKCPEVIRRHYEGSALSLWEIKEFVAWKSRLPNEEETRQALLYGVGAMKKLFKPIY